MLKFSHVSCCDCYAYWIPFSHIQCYQQSCLSWKTLHSTGLQVETRPGKGAEVMAGNWQEALWVSLEMMLFHHFEPYAWVSVCAVGQCLWFLLDRLCSGWEKRSSGSWKCEGDSCLCQNKKMRETRHQWSPLYQSSWDPHHLRSSPFLSEPQNTLLDSNLLHRSALEARRSP